MYPGSAVDSVLDHHACDQGSILGKVNQVMLCSEYYSVHSDINLHRPGSIFM